MWRIAHELGYPAPRLLIQDLGSSEVTEMLAYYTLFPFGEDRADLRLAIVAATQINSARTSSRQKTWRPSDLIPKYEEAARSQLQKKSGSDDDEMSSDEMFYEVFQFVTVNKQNPGEEGK